MKPITCKGFAAAGIASGLKKNGAKDLGLIYSETPANAAGVFTRNLVRAAPVLLDQERLKGGTCQAVIANSGNANCCTGEKGMADAVAMARAAGAALQASEELVCVASTGVIGQPLNIQKVEAAAPELVKALSEEGFQDFAEAILTTDLSPKTAAGRGEIDGNPYTVVGVAKGSGMIRPDMATMLCFICTDIKAETNVLQKTLTLGANRSFNRITVDGDTSTNDMILIMANGASGAEIDSTSDQVGFQAVLDDVLLQLAKMVVKDGEGATKLVEIQVQGAKSPKDARAVADTVAHSNLVKTALFGEDANWGRIIAAVGRAGAVMDPQKIDIFFNEVRMVENGLTSGDAAEGDATRIMKTPEYTIRIDLKMGEGKASVFTCDFSVDYVKINADYRS